MNNEKRKYTYFMFEDEMILDGDSYTSYGIGVREDKEVLRLAKDVSADRKEVERMLKLLNEQDVEPIHFYDVLEDMLP